MMRHIKNGGPLLPSKSTGPASSAFKASSVSSTTWLIVVIFSSCISFYLGVWAAWAVAPSSSDVNKLCLKAVNGEDKGELGRKVGEIFKTRLDGALHDDKSLNDCKCPEVKCPESNPASESNSGSKPRFNRNLNHFLAGAVSVNRKNLFDTFDFGVPISGNAENENTLILYDNIRSLPSDVTKLKAAQSNDDIPEMDASDATENCDTMNVVFIKNPQRNIRQCVALVGGQYQGYHVQRWMRVDGEGAHGTLDSKAPLHQVSRMTTTKGYDEFTMPKTFHLERHRQIMLTYLKHLNDMQKELKSTLSKIAVDNTVVVMTVNKGQSELLINFVCSAQSRGLDLKNVIVFPTDQFSKDIADGLGLATFYHEELTKGIPSEEAARYGDTTFGYIMMAKVICVQLVNELGYDMLFQDVDVVWYKNPIDYFNSPKAKDFDVYFQDDGNRQERFAPYAANSGFYFVRSNNRSKLLFRSMLNYGDLVFAVRSHQQILITLLAEMNSWAGLRVKVLNRDEDDFPSGYHYHTKPSWMKQMINGEKDPTIFHMCWTLNKEDKLLFMKQMGMWYVEDKCVEKESKQILSPSDSKDGLAKACCSVEPLTKCSFRDKPSLIPCNDLPPKDKGGRSFW